MKERERETELHEAQSMLKHKGIFMLLLLAEMNSPCK